MEWRRANVPQFRAASLDWIPTQVCIPDESQLKTGVQTHGPRGRVMNRLLATREMKPMISIRPTNPPNKIESKNHRHPSAHQHTTSTIQYPTLAQADDHRCEISGIPTPKISTSWISGGLPETLDDNPTNFMTTHLNPRICEQKPRPSSSVKCITYKQHSNRNMTNRKTKSRPSIGALHRLKYPRQPA